MGLFDLGLSVMLTSFEQVFGVNRQGARAGMWFNYKWEQFLSWHLEPAAVNFMQTGRREAKHGVIRKAFGAHALGCIIIAEAVLRSGLLKQWVSWPWRVSLHMVMMGKCTMDTKALETTGTEQAGSL
jgi:hypothetical protein